MEKGIVFDIQRFALHDGPGIRTTVFLKGCPLRCMWCHNPESFIMKPQLSYKISRCRHCLKCTEVCPTVVQISHGNEHVYTPELCQDHFKCTQVCPYDAIKVIGKEMDVETVMTEVEADLPYYQNTGGGITISGGEPMLQFAFTKALLISAKDKGIHTCLDTSGYAQADHFKEISPYTDLFLYDIKASGDEEHKRLTGVGNKRILENLDLLYGMGAAIRLRCPIIPGINDSDWHLEFIGTLASRYPNFEGIEIMAYHDLGRDKWEEVELEYPLMGLKSADETQKQQWLDKLGTVVRPPSYD